MNTIQTAYVYLRQSSGKTKVTISNIYGIGRNYRAHAEELGNLIPESPIVFTKPTSALIREPQSILLPSHSQQINFEAELVLLIGQVPEKLNKDNALKAIQAYGLGLDLTARDVQTSLKQKGLPWTIAKGFSGSAPVSDFLPANTINHVNHLKFTLHINGELRQQGDLACLLFSLADIICFLHKHFTLQPGDLIFTGTPEGVGVLQPGQQLILALVHYPLEATFTVTGELQNA